MAEHREEVAPLVLIAECPDCYVSVDFDVEGFWCRECKAWWPSAKNQATTLGERSSREQVC